MRKFFKWLEHNTSIPYPDRPADHRERGIEYKKRTIAVDFDLVIHNGYKGYDDGTIYGEPMEGTKFTLGNLLKKYNVVILTSRTPDEWPKMRIWLGKHDLPQLKITNTKPKNMQALIDNRAIRFVSWADIASYLL